MFLFFSFSRLDSTMVCGSCQIPLRLLSSPLFELCVDLAVYVNTRKRKMKTKEKTVGVKEMSSGFIRGKEF